MPKIKTPVMTKSILNTWEPYIIKYPIPDFDTNNSSSGFIGNLVGAFGLLGSNGFLACCKAVFGCFPSFIWDLLGAGLSAAIIIVLIKMLFS